MALEGQLTLVAFGSSCPWNWGIELGRTGGCCRKAAMGKTPHSCKESGMGEKPAEVVTSEATVPEVGSSHVILCPEFSAR